MANVLVQESSLQDIADAIRTKNGTQNTYKPAQMAGAIEAIPSGGGITPTGTINITANGTVDVTNYASASVAVPTGTTPTGTKQVSITQNGTTTEDVTNYASAEITVNVPSSSSVTGTFSIENDATSATTITTLTNIGFTPSIFIMYESQKQTTDTTQYGMCMAGYIHTGDFTIKSYERYSNTSGSVTAGSIAEDWTRSTAAYLVLSGDNVQFRASATCILLGGVTYNWIAIP